MSASKCLVDGKVEVLECSKQAVMAYVGATHEDLERAEAEGYEFSAEMIEEYENELGTNINYYDYDGAKTSFFWIKDLAKE